MLSKKNSQNIPDDLVFLEIVILRSLGTKILGIFNWKGTFQNFYIFYFLINSFENLVDNAKVPRF